MSITPDENRPLSATRCSGCGKELHVNQRAVYFDAMAEAHLLLGDCCADRVLGALIQDYAMALKNHSTTWPSHWITRLYPARMTSVAEAAATISEEYREAIPGIPYALNCNDKTKNRA